MAYEFAAIRCNRRLQLLQQVPATRICLKVGKPIASILGQSVPSLESTWLFPHKDASPEDLTWLLHCQLH